MSTPSPTQITVFLNPEDEEHALYLIGEFLPTTTFTIIDTQDEHVTWGSVFVLTHQEKRLTLALSAPATVGQIDDLASLVKIGLISGFVVKGGN